MPRQPSMEQVLSLTFAEQVNNLLYRGAADGKTAVSTAQLVALTFIQDNPGCTIKKLAGSTRVNHSAASQAIHKLAAEGLVEIAVAPADRREARLTLSRAGAAALQESRERRLDALEAILHRMSAAERARFIDGLSAFLRHALSSEGAVDDVCGRCWVEHFGDCIVNIAHRQITGRDTKRVPAAS